jgi:hypothetical protein
MAKRNKKGQFQKGHSGGGSTHRRASSSGSTKVVVVEPARAARAAPRRRTVTKTVVKRRRSSARRGGSILGGSVGNFLGGRGGHRTAIVIGSAALGYAQKEGWLAKLPVVGKAGPITSFGLLGWGAEEFLHMKLPPIVQDMITSALALSAFNLGFSGGQTIVGESYQMPGGAVFFD